MHYSKHKSSILSNFFQKFLSQWVIVLNHEGLKTKPLPLFNLLAQFNWGFDICNQQGVSPICMNALKQVTGKNRTSQERIGTFFQSLTSITILHQKVYSLTTNEQPPKSEYNMEHQPRLLNRTHPIKVFQLLYSSLPCRAWTSEFWGISFANWVMAGDSWISSQSLSLLYWKELKNTEILAQLCTKKDFTLISKSWNSKKDDLICSTSKEDTGLDGP